MREILFRGKRTDDASWEFGYYVHLGDCRNRETHRIYSGYAETDCGDFYPEWEEVSPETVCQYSGMEDKDGTKIFEGDIVLFDYIGANRGVNGKAAVIFSNGKFGVLWGWHKEFVPLDGFANTTLEVIGNIHDKPELLEGA